MSEGTTRISYYAALARITGAVSLKGNRMMVNQRHGSRQEIRGTRISYYAALARITGAVSLKGNRMMVNQRHGSRQEIRENYGEMRWIPTFPRRRRTLISEEFAHGAVGRFA